MLKDLAKGKNIRWIHVDGHAGVYGNEMADSLANKALDLSID